MSDNLELTDAEQTEESEVEEENPPTHPQTDNGEYSVIFLYEMYICKITRPMLNFSTDCAGMNTLKQPVEELPGTSFLSSQG